jgi:MFS family permease
VDDATENTLDKNIVNDAAGRALRVSQNGNKLYTHIVNGEIFGQHGVAPNELDPRTSGGQANFSQVAEFGFGYRGISGSYPAPSVGAYSVRQGDTLQSIAQAAYGDSRQWWRIAQANGLQGEQDLKVGQTLTLPSIAAGESNNTTTFKPYDASEIVGDLSPNLPQPKANDCGGMGMVIMIVVAVAVTVFTAGAAAIAMAGTLTSATSLGTIMAAGGAAMTGGAVGSAAALASISGVSAAGLAGAAVVGGAVGSIASQGVGLAIGAQEHFSWKQVAASAIASGVTAGVGGTLSGAGPALNKFFVRAAVSNALTQGISVSTGLQEHFSWTGVAAAAVGSAVGQAVGAGAGKVMDGLLSNEVAEKMVTGTLAGMASGATVTAMRGGRVSAAQIAADAFGNALGQGLVDEMNSPSPSSADNRTLLNKVERAADPDRFSTAASVVAREIAKGGLPEGALYPTWSDAAQTLAAAQGGSALPVAWTGQGNVIDPGSIESIRQPDGTYRVDIAGTSSSPDVYGGGSEVGSDEVIELPPVVITGKRMTEAEMAAYDAQLFQEENDQRVLTGTYDRFNEISDAWSAGQYGEMWRHIGLAPEKRTP